MSRVLQQHLLLAAQEPVCISASVREEAQGNLFSLCLPTSELAQLTAGDLETWLRSVVTAKRTQLLQGLGFEYPMCFYCWVDAQAGQLRFSLVAAGHAANLPFGCALRFVALAIVTQEYIDLLYSHLSASEESESQDDAPFSEAPFVLNIWVTHIP